MENHIIALDVDGIAGTMTAKRLTDLEVAQDYHDCRMRLSLMKRDHCVC